MKVEFDQHFLVNKDVLDEIIYTAKINSNEVIFEIGPGKGILTEEILKKGPKELISVELDKRLIGDLEELKKQYDNFDCILGDGVEKIDYYKFDKLIANIPYSITEPLYKKLLDRKIAFALLLHGKTFYDTVIRREGSRWHYFVNAFYDVELVMDIKGDCFEPVTKTTSALVLLKLKDKLSSFDLFLQTLYPKMSRTTYNSLVFTLVDYLGASKSKSKEIVDSLNIDMVLLNKAFDSLSNEDFCNIVLKLKEHLNL